MDQKTKQYLRIAVVTVVLFAALMNLRVVLSVLGQGARLLLPIGIGGILALFLSVPMNGIRKRLDKFFDGAKKKPSNAALHGCSFVLTLVGIGIVLFVTLTLLIPEIASSLQKLFAQIEAKLPEWRAYLDAQQIGAGWLREFLSELDLRQTIEKVVSGAGTLLPNVADALSATLNVFLTTGFSLIISIYVTLRRDMVCRHARKLVCAYVKPKWAARILRFFRMFFDSFTKFLSGQCFEAVILGVLMFLAFTIFRLPYGSLAGVLTAVCAIIPYIGAFISFTISVLLTLLLDPLLAIRCAIVYLVVQFVENQFIYPRVVGESVGLPPLYTLLAAMIGGKLFGILGIIFFIPLTAVVLELVKEDATRRLREKENTDNQT